MYLQLWANLVFLFVFLSSGNLLAQSSDVTNQEATALQNMSIEELMNVQVYSASKRQESLKDAPQVITVITPEQLKMFGLRTVHEALSLVPGFDIQPQLRKEFHWTRGVREAALILIDGTSVLNPSDNEAYLDEAFQIENIKQIEVVRGPGGVIWGANAFMGVVNVITKDPSKSPFASVNLSGGSYEARRVGFAASTFTGDLGIFISGKHLNTKKHEVKIAYQGEPARNETSYFSDLFLKLTWKELTFSLRRDRHKEYVPMSDLMNGTNSGAYTQTTFYESDPIDLYQLKWDHEFNENLVMHAKTSLLHRKIDMNAPRTYNGQGSPSTLYFDNLVADKYSTEIQFDHKWGESTNLIYGLGYDRVISYHNNIVVSGSTIQRAIADARISSYTGFLQFTQRLTDSFTAGAGVRGEVIDQQFQTETDLGFNSRKSAPQYLYNLNGVYKFAGGDHIKVIVAKGVRRPDVEQTTSSTGSFNGSDVTEEQSQTYESEYYWSINKNFSWSNNYSYNNIYGLIDFISTGPGVYTATNLPHAIVQTFESELRANLDNGSYGFLNFTYKDAKRADGKPIAGIDNTNKFNFNVAFATKLQSGFFWSNVVRYVGKKKDTYQIDDGTAPVASPAEKEVPDWTTLDTGLIYNDLGVKGLDLSFFVYNVLDKKYYMQNRTSKTGYLHPQAGRNLDLKLTYTF